MARAIHELESERVATPAGDLGVLAVEGTGQQFGPREAVADFPGPEPRFKPVRWERLSRYLDPLEGHIVAGRLQAEGVPATVEVTPPGFDMSYASAVWVPAEQVRRAQWILAWEPPTEAELTCLATGEIGE